MTLPLPMESVDFNKLSTYHQMPESVKKLIDQAKKNHYGELYEEQADGSVNLEDTLVELLDGLESETDYRLTHFRYVYMGMVLALAVVPTIEAYLSKDKILLPEKKVKDEIVDESENTIIDKVFSFIFTWFTTEGVNEARPKPQQINENRKFFFYKNMYE